MKQYLPWLQERPITLFVLEAMDLQDGSATGRRLIQLAERFLNVSLRYVGCSVRQTSVRQFLAAQDILGVVDSAAHERWLSTVQGVIDKVGRAPTADSHDLPDGYADALAQEPSARNSSVEIEFAIPVDAPLRNVELLEGFVLEHLSAFCGDTKSWERITPAAGHHAASLLRVVTSDGCSRVMVLSTGPMPGILEHLLALSDGPTEESEILWVGFAPTQEQRTMLDRLEMAVRHVQIRHICVEGQIGILVDRANT